MLVLVAGFLGLGWWQVSRARAGNTLSFAYAVEWPLFAAFVVGIWVREIRAELRGESDSGPPPEPEPVSRQGPVVIPVRQGGPVEPEDPALAAYNRYLAWLAANPDRRPSEYLPTEHTGGPLQE